MSDRDYDRMYTSFSLVKIWVIILIRKIRGHDLTKMAGNTYIFH